jgi:aryl-alcohol dehydrogenase-like predicted oxidoreductase
MTTDMPPTRFTLAPGYDICRTIVGGWQFSPGHGAHADKGTDPVALFTRLVDLGYTTFDCADIYQGVEEFLGQTMKAVGSTGESGAGPAIQVHTKFVPDLDVLPSIGRTYVNRIVDRSLTRLGVERLDLLQFHWWDFTVPGFVDVAGWLTDLKDQGKIRNLGVTNFDRKHLALLVQAGAPVVSNQVQYSLLDRRPGLDLSSYCTEKGIHLLCYGGLAGGFLADSWVGRDQPEPATTNRSLVKYHLIVEEMGGWSVFQPILEALKLLALKHDTPLASIALAWVLAQDTVAATITGMDSVAQAEELLKVSGLVLDEEDYETLAPALAEAKGPSGPVYGLERDRNGPHGRIMRYNLNRE